MKKEPGLIARWLTLLCIGAVLYTNWLQHQSIAILSARVELLEQRVDRQRTGSLNHVHTFFGNRLTPDGPLNKAPLIYGISRKAN